MKFKKLFTGIITITALFVGGSFINNSVKADNVPTNNTQTQLDKSTIIKKINEANIKDPQSFHMNESTTISFKYNKRKSIKATVNADAIFREKPSIAKIVYTSGKDKFTLYETKKYLYTKEGKHWTKTKSTSTTDVKKLSKKDKELVQKFTSIFEKRLSQNLGSSKIDLNNLTVNNSTITSENNNYIVTVNNNAQMNNVIKQFMMAFVQATASKKEADKVEKHLNVNNFNYVEKVDQNTYKLKKVSFAFQMSYGKEFKSKVTETIDGFNQHNNLKVPIKIVKHAKLEK